MSSVSDQVEAGEVQRLRDALAAIAAKWVEAHESWYPDRGFATEASKNWHDGFVTALATVHGMARKALDPAGEMAAEKLWQDGLETSDADWFARTGNCGHCGNPGGDCVCRPEEPCGCGPHERRTIPRPCWRCAGTGWDHPISALAGQLVLQLPVEGSPAAAVASGAAVTP